MRTKLTDKSKEFEKGNKVHFVAPHLQNWPRNKYAAQNGVVKEVTPAGIFVVFHVADTWEDFEQFTGQLTDPAQLYHGWL
jgi:hypothetical protein